MCRQRWQRTVGGVAGGGTTRPRSATCAHGPGSSCSILLHSRVGRIGLGVGHSRSGEVELRTVTQAVHADGEPTVRRTASRLASRHRQGSSRADAWRSDALRDVGRRHLMERASMRRRPRSRAPGANRRPLHNRTSVRIVGYFGCRGILSSTKTSTAGATLPRTIVNGLRQPDGARLRTRQRGVRSVPPARCSTWNTSCNRATANDDPQPAARSDPIRPTAPSVTQCRQKSGRFAGRPGRRG